MRRIGPPPPEFAPVHVERLDEEALAALCDEELTAHLAAVQRQERLLRCYIEDIQEVLDIRGEDA